jgi:YggT family protein
MLIEALTRQNVASYIDDLFSVYIALLLVYLLVNLVLSFGATPPYTRSFDAVMGFLRDVSEPYLRVFRRLIPAMGGIDLSPMLAIIVLILLRQILSNAIS